MTGTMKTAALGRTGMQISRVGFGAWAIGGGDWEFGWGPQQDEQSVAAIHRALELGVNWIDTAAAYGLGRSEEIVGQALAGVTERPYVFTKCSLLEGPGRTVVHDLSRDSVLREAEASLKRLGIDAIDLYQIHWPNPAPQIEQGWAALAELKEQGVVRHIGVSNFDVAQLRRIQQIAPVETLQPPYSLLAREAEGELLPFAEHAGIGVIVYSPMGSGLLSGRMTRERIAALPDDDWREATPSSGSRSCPATWPRCSGWRPWPSDTAPPRARSRSPGLCATRPSTPRSSASGGRIRSTRWSLPLN